MCKLQMLFLGLLVKKGEFFLKRKKATPSTIKRISCCVITMEGLLNFWADCGCLLGNVCVMCEREMNG